jgi:hypothetical protein
MTQTNQNDIATATNHPALDLEALRSELQELARATVDKTLQQARETRTDPVLGCSSALATFYMMMPRNDGRAQEQILDIVARHVDSLTVIRNGLKFGIDPTHLGLVQSNPSAVLAQLQSDHDPEPRGPTYRADGLVINQTTGKACLLEFKRQASTIETTRLNQIADNLTIARAQVSDLLYRKHKRMKIEPEAVSWAIIDCSDQELPQRFTNTGVLGLDSLDAICGVQNVAAAYRLTREVMAAEFRRGEGELMKETQDFIPLDTAEAMIDAAVTAERQAMAERVAQVPTHVPPALSALACSHVHTVQTTAGNPEDPDDPAFESLREPDGKYLCDADDEGHPDHQPTIVVPFPSDRRTVRRRYGMFGT